MKKIFTRIVGFIICTNIVLLLVLDVLSPKGGSGIYDLKEFYKLDKDSVDVLMLGSSLSFINIDPAVIYDETGVTAYSLGGAIQPLWNTYYYLKESLKSQKPKLITLEIYSSQVEYEPNNSYVLNNISAIRSPLNRLLAVSCSTSKDQWIPMFLGFPNYHDRYASLTNEDYQDYRGLKDFEYYLGHGTYYKTTPCTEPNPYVDAEALELPEKSEKYLRKIIELCKEKNIDLLLFASPTALYSDLKGYYLTVKELAEEYGINFFDFNYCYDSIGLNFEKDFADENHLNQSGCPKFSSYFADYLVSNYKLIDYRLDDNCARWRKASDFRYAMSQDFDIAQTNNLEEHLDNVINSKFGNVIDYIWVKGNESEYVKCILSSFEIPLEEGVYKIQNGFAERLDFLNERYNFDFGKDVYTCYEDSLEKNKTELFNTNEILTTVTLDNYTMKVFDSCNYDENGNKIEKLIEVTWSWVGTGD